MLSLDEKTIRASFVNATRKELTDLTIPDLATVDFDRLDYFGWRDARLARRAYFVVHLADGPVGVVLKQADGAPRSRAQCSWCQDIHLPNDVVMFGARRTGAAGRGGNSIATLICSNFECSTNVRKKPPMAYIGFDAEAAREQRIVDLRVHVGNFVRNVRDGS